MVNFFALIFFLFITVESFRIKIPVLKNKSCGWDDGLIYQDFCLYGESEFEEAISFKNREFRTDVGCLFNSFGPSDVAKTCGIDTNTLIQNLTAIYEGLADCGVEIVFPDPNASIADGRVPIKLGSNLLKKHSKNFYIWRYGTVSWLHCELIIPKPNKINECGEIEAGVEKGLKERLATKYGKPIFEFIYCLMEYFTPVGVIKACAIDVYLSFGESNTWNEAIEALGNCAAEVFLYKKAKGIVQLRKYWLKKNNSKMREILKEMEAEHIYNKLKEEWSRSEKNEGEAGDWCSINFKRKQELNSSATEDSRDFEEETTLSHTSLSTSKNELKSNATTKKTFFSTSTEEEDLEKHVLDWILDIFWWNEANKSSMLTENLTDTTLEASSTEKNLAIRSALICRPYTDFDPILEEPPTPFRNPIYSEVPQSRYSRNDMEKCALDLNLTKLNWNAQTLSNCCSEPFDWDIIAHHPFPYYGNTGVCKGDYFGCCSSGFKLSTFIKNKPICCSTYPDGSKVKFYGPRRWSTDDGYKATIEYMAFLDEYDDEESIGGRSGCYEVTLDSITHRILEDPCPTGFVDSGHVRLKSRIWTEDMKICCHKETPRYNPHMNRCYGKSYASEWFEGPFKARDFRLCYFRGRLYNGGPLCDDYKSACLLRIHADEVNPSG